MSIKQQRSHNTCGYHGRVIYEGDFGRAWVGTALIQKKYIQTPFKIRTLKGPEGPIENDRIDYRGVRIKRVMLIKPKNTFY